jgi:hypothetical protein
MKLPFASRVTATAGLSGLEEGTQEVAEGMAGRYGMNEAAGIDRSITEGTLNEFALGAMGGAPMGAIGGALNRGPNRSPPRSPNFSDSPPRPMAARSSQGHPLHHQTPWAMAAHKVRHPRPARYPPVQAWECGHLHGRQARKRCCRDCRSGRCQNKGV